MTVLSRYMFVFFSAFVCVKVWKVTWVSVHRPELRVVWVWNMKTNRKQIVTPLLTHWSYISFALPLRSLVRRLGEEKSDIQLRENISLQWRHNEYDGVSNHQLHDCLLKRLFRRRSKKHQSSASRAFVRGIHRWPVNSPHKRPVTRKMFPFDDVIIYGPMTALSIMNCFSLGL